MRFKSMLIFNKKENVQHVDVNGQKFSIHKAQWNVKVIIIKNVK